MSKYRLRDEVKAELDQQEHATQAHEDLKKRIIRLLVEFQTKYMAPEMGLYPTGILIEQNVLSELLEEIEKDAWIIPQFTPKQIDYLTKRFKKILRAGE